MSAAHYYKLYKAKKKEAKEHGENIKYLQKIAENITDDLDDEIRKVNDELDDLKEDLLEAVRYNSTFTKRANDFPSKKEKAVSSDPPLSSAVSYINNEISSLQTKKRQAEYDRDRYYDRYLDCLNGD